MATVTVQHVFSSPKADGPHTDLLQPSHWNATHAVTVDGVAGTNFAGTNVTGTLNSAGLSLSVAAPGAVSWGAITGTLSNQTDLQAEFNNKANTNHTHSQYLTTALTDPTQFIAASISSNIQYTSAMSNYQSAGAYLTTQTVQTQGTFDSNNLTNYQLTSGTSAITSLAFPTANTTQFAGLGTTTAATNANVTLNVGTNGIALSVSANAGGGGGVAISAGTNSTATGTVQFANSNNVTFGMNTNGVVTASASVAAGGGDGWNPIAAGGSTGNSTQSIVFGNANGVSFSLNGGTITASHNAITSQSVQTQNSVLVNGNSGAITVAGTTTGSQSTAGTDVVLTLNSNGLNLGVPKYITTYVAQTVQPVAFSASGSSSNFSTLQFGNSNGVSFSISNGSVVGTVKTDYQSSNANYLTSQSIQTQNSVLINGNSGAMTVAGTSTGSQSTAGSDIVMTHNSNGLNLGVPKYITTYAAQTVDTNKVGIGNVSTVSTAGSLMTGSAGTNGVTLAVPAFLTTAAGGGGAALSAGTSSQNSGTVIFSNSNGVSFGMNGGTITATVVPGAAAGVAAFANTQTTYTSGTVGLLGAGAVTIASTTGNQFQMSVPAQSVISGNGNVTVGTTGSTIGISAGAAAPTVYFAQPLYPQMALLTNITGSEVSQRMLLFPFQVEGNMTCNEVMWQMSRATSNVDSFGLSVAIYSKNNSSQIGLISSTAQGYTVTNTSANSGVRIWEADTPVTSMSGGEYVLGMMFSAAATISMNHSLMGWATASLLPLGVIHSGAANTTVSANLLAHQIQPFWGRVSTSTNAVPSTIAMSDVQGMGTKAIPMWFAIGQHNG